MSAGSQSSIMSRLHKQDFGPSVSLQMLHGIGIHEDDNDQTSHNNCAQHHLFRCTQSALRSAEFDLSADGVRLQALVQGTQQ